MLEFMKKYLEILFDDFSKKKYAEVYKKVFVKKIPRILCAY